VSRILISGASGLIGQAISRAFESKDDLVQHLVRHPPRSKQELQWDPVRAVSPALVSGFDAVIHLSGETVVGRWTEAKKQRIRDSRVVSTQNLASALTQAEKPPQTLICASAIGYYGNRGDEVLTEDSPSGEGFLAGVSREWEAATQPATNAGIRTVNLRIGIVLSRNGGALKQMLLPFRLGLGGKIGSGRQWWSWIHIDDLVGAVLHILQDTSASLANATNRPPHAEPQNVVERRASSPGTPLTGAINIVSPNPVTNADFTKTLANTLHRPALFPVPAFAAKLAFGEFAEEGLLASARIMPKKLTENEFRFRYPELGVAIRELL
jgi:uncharacterized protein